MDDRSGEAMVPSLLSATPATTTEGGVMFDITSSAVEHALHGLRVRSDVRANNIANANTPGFRASRVDFEAALKAAIERRGPVAAPAVTPDLSIPSDGASSVNIETEMVGMLKDNLLRESMVAAFNHKADVLRSAIRGQ
jgi:flagellar basal-body rod protein FlgB